MDKWHVHLRGEELSCDNCGAMVTLSYRITEENRLKLCRAFHEEHKGCVHRFVSGVPLSHPMVLQSEPCQMVGRAKDGSATFDVG